jgi:hypothetical protein
MAQAGHEKVTVREVESPSFNSYADALVVRTYLRRLIDVGIDVPVEVLRACDRIVKREVPWSKQAAKDAPDAAAE